MQGPFMVVCVGLKETASAGETYRYHEQWGVVITCKPERARGRNCVIGTQQELYVQEGGCLVRAMALGSTMWALLKYNTAGREMGA